jgi:folylpolyglutamate synthase/dihydropteroate synthase
MTFEEAMLFVEHERAWPSDPSRVHGERFAALLARAAIDLSRVPAVVVAGSAGKGSTTRMIAALARGVLDRAADRRSLVFGTKPPLRETDDGHRERYQSIEPGESTPRWITRERFTEHVAFLAPLVRELERTHGRFAPFDLRYAVLAREAMMRGAALVVVEANIGLRNDVSRAWPNVVATVLTKIGVEHGALLTPPDPLPDFLAPLGAAAGPTWHKAGGVFPDRLVIVAPQTAVVREAIDRLASYVVDADDGGVDFTLGLLGDYQRDNARTAITCVRELVRTGVLPGDASAVARVAARLADVRVPGRLEIVAHDPLTIRNVTEAPTKARATLDAVAGPLRVVLTTIARVEGAEDVVRIFASCDRTTKLYATAWHASDAQRDMAPERIAQIARAAHPGLDVVIETDAATAIRRARAEAHEGETVLLIGDGLANAWEESISVASDR